MPTTSWWHNSTNQQFNFPRPLIHTEQDEKGKMKKEKGKGEKAAGASIHPDESELLGNRLLPAGPQTATLKAPPFEGGLRGVKQCRELPKLLIGRHDLAPPTLNLIQPPSPTEEAPNNK